jgi:hypothetical protein
MKASAEPSGFHATPLTVTPVVVRLLRLPPSRETTKSSSGRRGRRDRVGREIAALIEPGTAPLVGLAR